MYGQGRNRFAEVENKRGYQGDREGWDELEDWNWDTYTVDATYTIDN